MTVRIERTLTFDAPAEQVWEFIADPAKRAEAISVVESYDLSEDEGAAVWHISLPIPGIGATVPIETEETERDPPDRVEFVGRSKALRVTGTHSIESSEDGTTTLYNEFVVDGRLPGVERFFKKNFEKELDNLEAALRKDLGLTA